MRRRVTRPNPRAHGGSALMAAAGALLLALGSGCTERQTTTDSLPLPVSSPAVILNPPSSPGALPEDVQELPISIEGGRFGADRYSAQVGPIVLRVTTGSGGPYILSIDGLLPPQQVPAQATTNVGVTAPTAGDYVMRLSGGSSATAILNVRRPGFR